jgi:hypothetical protein
MIKRYFILDRSGSMELIAGDTIGGFNAFVESQKPLGGTMSLYLFDNYIETVYQDVFISDVIPLTRATFTPRGATGLLDAIGTVINGITKGVNELIQIVIMTDGFENCSSKFKPKYIKELIENKILLGWDFMYLGANQDSVLQAGNLGINPEQTLDFDINNLSSVMQTVSITMSERAQGTPTTLRRSC